MFFVVFINHNDARLKIIAVGLTIRGKAIPTYDQHPNIVRDAEGNIIHTTKLSVSNIPWSVSVDDVIHALKELNVEFTSGLNCENLRSPEDNSLITRCYNGTLYFFIKKPDQVLPSSVKIGTFKAFLRHKEQIEEAICNNCLQKGHFAKKCKNQTVCLDCRKPGHKRGDKACTKGQKEDDTRDEERDNNKDDDNGKEDENNRKEGGNYENDHNINDQEFNNDNQDRVEGNDDQTHENQDNHEDRDEDETENDQENKNDNMRNPDIVVTEQENEKNDENIEKEDGELSDSETEMIDDNVFDDETLLKSSGKEEGDEKEDEDNEKEERNIENDQNTHKYDYSIQKN